MTNHIFICGNALESEIDKDVDLIVTSPPYPMIEMWDECFSGQNPEINLSNPITAWKLMTKVIEDIITKSVTKLKDGGFLIINIGDATRTINDSFALYPTHSLLDYHCINLGLTRLPCILWNKASNKPNKYMGSGMLPSGAYVTLEHEYILIYRKGIRKEFTDKEARRKSAFFWEERNKWFSDMWTIRGAAQKLDIVRSRSAAYPHELVYRLIAMYSCYDDVVLDPFSGLGTTALAAMNLGRNSVNIESHKLLIEQSTKRLLKSKDFCNTYTKGRLERHIQFVKHAGKDPKYTNKHYAFKVMTKQEESLVFKELSEISLENNVVLCDTIDMNV